MSLHKCAKFSKFCMVKVSTHHHAIIIIILFFFSKKFLSKFGRKPWKGFIISIVKMKKKITIIMK